MKVQRVGAIESSVPIYRTARCYAPEYHNRNNNATRILTVLKLHKDCMFLGSFQVFEFRLFGLTMSLSYWVYPCLFLIGCNVGHMFSLKDPSLFIPSAPIL